MVLLVLRNLFILLIIKSVGSKNISFNSFKSNIILQNLTLTSKFFLREVYIFIYEGKHFHHKKKNVKNEEMI